MKKRDQWYWNLEARVVALENPTRNSFTPAQSVNERNTESWHRAFATTRTQVREQQKQIDELMRLKYQWEEGIKTRRQIMEEMTFTPPPPEPKPYKAGRCSHCNKRIHQMVEGIPWAHDENNNVFCGWVKAAPR